MKKLSIIYWSGTGNTQAMAEAMAEAAKSEGTVEVELLTVSKATIGSVLDADIVALGCSAMGDEVLEEDEMEPFVMDLEKESLEGKPMALFGSYDWGDGQWMREWEERMKKTGVQLLEEGLIVQNMPDDEGLQACKDLGVKLAKI